MPHIARNLLSGLALPPRRCNPALGTFIYTDLSAPYPVLQHIARYPLKQAQESFAILSLYVSHDMKSRCHCWASWHRWLLDFQGCSAANGGLRDGGLSKSEDICGKRPFSSVFWISQVLFTPSGKGRKRQKKGEKGRFWPISGKGGQTPLNPHLLHPHLRQPNRDARGSPLLYGGPLAQSCSVSVIIILLILTSSGLSDVL